MIRTNCSVKCWRDSHVWFIIVKVFNYHLLSGCVENNSAVCYEWKFAEILVPTYKHAQYDISLKARTAVAVTAYSHKFKHEIRSGIPNTILGVIKNSLAHILHTQNSEERVLVVNHWTEKEILWSSMQLCCGEHNQQIRKPHIGLHFSTFKTLQDIHSFMYKLYSHFFK